MLCTCADIRTVHMKHLTLQSKCADVTSCQHIRLWMNHGLVQLKFCRQHPYTMMIPTIWVEGRVFLNVLNRKAGHCLKVPAKETHLIVSTRFLEMLQWGHSCRAYLWTPIIYMSAPPIFPECLIKDRFSIIILTVFSTVFYLCLVIDIIWILLGRPGQKATYYLRKLNWRMGHRRYHWEN